MRVGKTRNAPKRVLDEKTTQLAVCKYLRSMGVMFWRSNNMPTYDPKLGMYRAMGEFSVKGVPDIICIGEGGIFIGLEIKGTRGVVSADQILFKKRCERLGAQYHIIRDVEEVKRLF
jgi:hypothetical protein